MWFICLFFYLSLLFRMSNNFLRRRPTPMKPFKLSPMYKPRPGPRRYLSKNQLQSAKVASARYLATLSSKGNVGEVKWFDSRIRDLAVDFLPSGLSILNARSIDNVTQYYSLNCPAQGNSDNERIGKQIKMKSLFIRGDVTLNSSTLDDLYCRVVVYIDTQNNNTVPSASSVIPFDELTSYGSYLAMRNLDYTSRFRILHDEMLHFKPQFTSWYNGTAAVHQSHPTSMPFSKFINLKGMKVNFNATGATSASIVDNAIYVVAFCNTPNSSVSSTVATCNYVARLRYTE